VSKDQKDNTGIVQSPPLIFAVLLAAGLLLNNFFPLNILPNSDALLKMSGNVLIVIYVIINIPTITMMVRKKTGISTHKQTTALVMNGFFKYSRNPLYFSLLLLYIGIALYVNSLWSLFFFPVLVIMLDRLVIIREEKYLESKFGNEYLDYKKNVRRWI
jgi:protein-S-isoprenylcysteine O-methyltransferase Ste14